MAYYFPKEKSTIGFNSNRSYYDDYYDNWGYSSYKKTQSREYSPPKKKKEEWSFTSFGSFFKEDDDLELIVKDSEQYSTPKRYDIERRLSKYPKTFESNLIKDLSRMFYHKMMEIDNFIKDDLDTSTMSPEDLDYYTKANDILEECSKKDIPGWTPLDKALFVYEELSKSQNQDVASMKSGDILKQLGEIDRLDRGVYEDKDLNELMTMSDFLKKFKSQIFKKMSLIKSFGGKFKVEKEITAKAVQNSKIIVPKMLTEFEQLPLIDKYQFALPHFNSKLALKDLNVRCPIEKTEHKQKIIILVDSSGSMHDDLKQQWVCSILMDRMRYVVKGDAEIFFSYFIETTHQFYHIKDKKDVMNFWRTVYKMPSGGKK